MKAIDYKADWLALGEIEEHSDQERARLGFGYLGIQIPDIFRLEQVQTCPKNDEIVCLKICKV